MQNEMKHFFFHTAKQKHRYRGNLWLNILILIFLIFTQAYLKDIEVHGGKNIRLTPNECFH